MAECNWNLFMHASFRAHCQRSKWSMPQAEAMTGMVSKTRMPRRIESFIIHIMNFTFYTEILYLFTKELPNNIIDPMATAPRKCSEDHGGFISTDICDMASHTSCPMIPANMYNARNRADFRTIFL